MSQEVEEQCFKSTWFLLQSYCMLTEIGLGAGYIIGKQADEGESEEFIVMI